MRQRMKVFKIFACSAIFLFSVVVNAQSVSSPVTVGKDLFDKPIVKWTSPDGIRYLTVGDGDAMLFDTSKNYDLSKKDSSTPRILSSNVKDVNFIGDGDSMQIELILDTVLSDMTGSGDIKVFDRDGNFIKFERTAEATKLLQTEITKTSRTSMDEVKTAGEIYVNLLLQYRSPLDHVTHALNPASYRRMRLCNEWTARVAYSTTVKMKIKEIFTLGDSSNIQRALEIWMALSYLESVDSEEYDKKYARTSDHISPKEFLRLKKSISRSLYLGFIKKMNQKNGNHMAFVDGDDVPIEPEEVDGGDN